MYYQYFGLTEPPFSIAVDPRYLFMSPRHRDALAHLLYGVGSGGGFILLTGEVGTGKTTINRCLLEQLPQDTDIAIILNPALNAQELLASVCDELGIQYDGGQPTLKALTDNLHAFLLENHGRGRKTVLMIDEAQHLDFDVLEQIRLLTNLETNSEKLLQIILIGQPELAQMLARPELRQLNQRITARYNLEPLNLDETGAYIHHRLQVAGMSPERVIFPRSVVRGIHRATRGIPRVINVLCDRMLLGAYGRNRTRADNDMLRLALREVLGEEQRPRRWPWMVGAAAVLLAAAALGWWWFSGAPLQRDDRVAGSAAGHVTGGSPAPVLEAVKPVPEAVTPVPEAARPVPGPVAPTPAMAPAAPSPVREAQQTVAGTAPLASQTPVTERDPLAAAMLAPGEAMAVLWRLYGLASFDGPDCPNGLVEGVACAQGESQTWDELSRMDRPVVLSMVTAERFAAQAMLLGMDGTNAWVLADDGIEMVPLSRLAPFWTGAYTLLWRPPAGFSRPLSRGDRSPVVAEVASLFARLDGMDEPLAGALFNDVLEQRVRMFQSRHGLEADGVVGMRTLLKLNEQLGVDTTARDAREQLRAGVASGGEQGRE
jgi:general secretion pathway protein A